MSLPVLAVLPELRAALAANRPVALVAPPGAGKTTAVPPALLDADWVAGGRLILLSPRRLAARAAATRMAELAGEPVGRTIGYRTRMDSRVSAATRIEVVTEGIFTRMLVADPDLPGIAAVLFDEVHERSLDSDLALALTLEAREALRPDLRLLLMSATLDGASYDAIIPDLAHVASEGRMFPVTLRHIGRSAETRIEDAVTAAVRLALAEEPGSVLAFLPGAAEIERTALALAEKLPADVDLHRLYGAREGADQRAAIAPAPAGRRKVVLATSIAETSITIDGVRVVIDSGLARRPRYDRAVGLTRLVTERASQAAVTQRAGRAGRTASGVAIRLWEAAETAGRPRFDPPEILESDLSGLVLECARWGVTDPQALRWRDAPPVPALAEARDRLQALGAIDAEGRVTAHGERLAGLPLAPPLAAMLLAGAARGWGRLAGDVAAVLTERGLGGRGADLDERLRHWRRDRGQRAQAARQLPERWAKLAAAPGNDRHQASPLPFRGGVGGGLSPLPFRGGVGGGESPDLPEDAAAQLLAMAFPDRVARRRGQAANGGVTFLMANGRAVVLDAAEPLARADWLVVGDASGAAGATRLLLGAAIVERSVETLFADRIAGEAVLAFDPATGGVVAERQRRLGAITLARGALERPDPAAVAAALLAGVRGHGLALLPWSEAAGAFRARAAFARAQGLAIADLSDAALLDRLDDWLPPLLAGRRRLGDIDPQALTQALEALIGWPGLPDLDGFAPRQFVSPAGSHHAIDYGAEGGPAVDVRVQALFGLAAHPTVARGQVPLTLRLTSPAGRPIQVTKDLPRFWAGSWADVRKDLRGRYPKHPWPEDPTVAPPTLRAKRPGQGG